MICTLTARRLRSSSYDAFRAAWDLTLRRCEGGRASTMPAMSQTQMW